MAEIETYGISADSPLSKAALSVNANVICEIVHTLTGLTISEGVCDDRRLDELSDLADRITLNVIEEVDDNTECNATYNMVLGNIIVDLVVTMYVCMNEVIDMTKMQRDIEDFGTHGAMI